MSLLADLFRKIESIAKEQGAHRVTKVQLELGVMAHISPEHLREHFERAALGTVADNAELVIELNEDPNNPQAQSILLKSVDVQ